MRGGRVGQVSECQILVLIFIYYYYISSYTNRWILTLKAPITYAADDIFMIFFYFSKKIHLCIYVN